MRRSDGSVGDAYGRILNDFRWPGLRRCLFRIGIPLATAVLTGCFTEIGNPGKEQTVSARFRIDYGKDAAPAPKSSAGNLAASVRRATEAASAAGTLDSLRIHQFLFNVVEVNYETDGTEQGRIWKVPDSLGKPVDFTGADPEAVLPPVAVPPAEYALLKVESRIPAHAEIDPDTLDFGRFGGRGYIKGTAYYAEKPVRFLCQFTNDYKINLVYSREILEQWRQGDSYSFDFVFFAYRWLSAADLRNLPAAEGVDGSFVLIDQEHNPEVFAALRASFFKSFNSTKVWKENPAP